LSSAIICNSNNTTAFFKRHNIDTRIIYNGIDLQEFENAQERGRDLRTRLGLEGERMMVGMVGSVKSNWKKHALFLQTVALLREQFPECQFVVYGGSADLDATPYTQQLMETAQALRITDRVTWVGFTEDIPAIMHSLDILVHPTAQEGSGRVVMEAMAAGKPVVGVRSGGVQELIQDQITGFLVQPDDARALAEATGTLLIDAKLRERMGQNGKSTVREHFSVEKTAALVQDLYREVLQSKQLRSGMDAKR
jgi:glycosyltransferase involved in cell wall biosynthesis